MRGPLSIGKNMLRTLKTVPKKASVKDRANIIFDDFLHPLNNIVSILLKSRT
jgi:hypothetical protein